MSKIRCWTSLADWMFGKEFLEVLPNVGTVRDHSVAKDELIQAMEDFLVDSLGTDRKGKVRS